MKLHLDTSYLIDWSQRHPGAVELGDAILAGAHEISVDPIIHTEYFAAVRIDTDKAALFDAVLDIAEWISLTPAHARLAASWLAPMDERMRRAHFADALIAAVASVGVAALVTGDRRIGALFPIEVREY